MQDKDKLGEVDDAKGTKMKIDTVCLSNLLPNLRELIICNMTVPEEQLTLSSMPRTLQRLMLIDVKVIAKDQNWLVKLIKEMDSKRHSRGTKFVHFEWRPRPEERLQLSTYALAVEKTSLPFRLEDYANGQTRIVKDFGLSCPRLLGDVGIKIDALSQLVTPSAPSRISSLSWSLDRAGRVTMTKVCESSLDSVARHLSDDANVAKSPSVTMMDLPEEVLLSILQYCDPADLPQLALTCGKMSRLARDMTLTR